MTDSNFTVIQLVVDRSGSMGAIRSDAEGAINYYIEQQKKEPGRCSLRLTQFDDEIEVYYELRDINSVVDPYLLLPRGSTALNDAIGKSAAELGIKLASMPENQRPGHVIFVIVTDGKENSSVEYREADMVKDLIEKQQTEFGWEFIFLAANQDAVLTGSRLGVRRESSLSFSGTGDSYAAVMDSAAYYSSSVRSGVAASFTEEDRKRAEES
jgi:hypothetical protein